MQFCLAHLIRDVKFLATLPEVPMTIGIAYGQRLLEGLRQLFHILHQREMMEPPVFQQTLEKARNDMLAVGLDAPEHKPARNMAKRFRQNGDSYFRFITTPGHEPTNNLAEQAIRFVVLDRYVTQGTRSQRGQKWCERIWTAIATCTQQQRSAFEFLYQSIRPSTTTSRESLPPRFSLQARERLRERLRFSLGGDILYPWSASL
jgi:hypothetical protein